jgi:hypothetical protein
MARIVAVHGIGNQYSGPESMKSDWLPALRDGIILSGGAKLPETEFDCAFYGNLFRNAGTRGGHLPPLDASDVEPGWEQEMLSTLWREAAQRDPNVTGPEDKDTRVWAPGWVQRALLQLSKSRTFAGAAENLLIFDLKQVKLYLHDERVRAEAKARVKAVVTDDTRVLIGHSLGSVVAYETLFELGNKPRLFVTLGSPLGIPNLIFHRLRPAPAADTGIWPGVVRWVNVSDLHDVVALDKKLSHAFGSKIEDVRIDNGADAHNVRPYLTARETGAAIASELGD